MSVLRPDRTRSTLGGCRVAQEGDLPMRAWMLPVLLLGVGCKHLDGSKGDECPPVCPAEETKAEACPPPAKPPCPPQVTAQVQPPKVEVKPAAPMHVKLPPQKIVVESQVPPAQPQAVVPMPQQQMMMAQPQMMM